MIVLLLPVSIGAQQLTLRKGLRKATITKGMHLDFFLKSDSITDQSKWRNLKCFCNNQSLRESLWQVDSIGHEFFRVRRPQSFEYDTLTIARRRLTHIRSMVKLGWTVHRTKPDTSGGMEYILKKVETYEYRNLDLGDVASLRFSESQNCFTQDTGTPLVMLGGTAATLYSKDNGVYRNAPLASMMMLGNLTLMAFWVDWIRNEKVKTYELSQWKTSFSYH